MIAHVLLDDPQLSLADMPNWLAVDFRDLRPSIAGPARLTSAIVTAFSAVGITARVEIDEHARANVRVNEIPVTALGFPVEGAIDREVDLTTDYVMAYPAAGFNGRAVSLMVRDEAFLVAAITGERPWLIYARRAAAARCSAGVESMALLTRLAQAELNVYAAEILKEQALVAAAEAWVGLRDASQTALGLQADLRRLTMDKQQLEQGAQKLVDALTFAVRLLEDHHNGYACLIRALGLFRKKRAALQRQSGSAGAPHGADPLVDIISLLWRARADFVASQNHASAEAGPLTVAPATSLAPEE